jgi:hypothetical protein
METRSCQRDLYRHEFSTASDHKRLLQLAKSFPANWIISGYRSALYNELLSDWRRVDFQAMTRRGLVTESLWCNFPAPKTLHDSRYVGRDNIDRQRIRRKCATWKNRLTQMPDHERQAVLDTIRDLVDENDRQRSQTEKTSADLADETNCDRGRSQIQLYGPTTKP